MKQSDASDTIHNLIVEYASESDHGKDPWVVNIQKLTLKNKNFRTTEWTGDHLQMTLMSIKPGNDVGLEKHTKADQFLRIESGKAKIVMGSSKNSLDQEWEAEDDFAIFVPSGTWHNIINIGDEDLKLYSIYSPSEHPPGTIHKTQQDAEKEDD